jgi:hypothetical protein
MQANPDVFHSIAISILFQHFKQLMKLTDVKKKKGILQVRDSPEVQRVSTLDRYCPELSSKRIWKT